MSKLTRKSNCTYKHKYYIILYYDIAVAEKKNIKTNICQQNETKDTMYLCHEHDNGHQIFIMTGWFLLKYSQSLTIVAVFCQKLQKI